MPHQAPDNHVSDSATARPVLRVRDLAVSFSGVRAVDSVSLTVYPGQTVAVVGESGCGKSVTAMSTLRLIPTPPGRIDRGSILLGDGQSERDILRLSEAQLRAVRGNEIAMIFQEPMTSLNPVFTIGEQIRETVMLHQRVGRAEADRAAVAALESVGISDARARLGAYPHEFSGGMRQRVMIAMALACRPRVLLADEPTTALDVTIQAQILALLRGLATDSGMAIVLITHDLGVVAENADVVCVMYAGRVVEYATVPELFANPLHPYTRALLACIPRLGLPGDVTRERLVTVRDVMNDETQFRSLMPRPSGSPGTAVPASGTLNDSACPRAPLRPWWPDHPPPEGTAAGSDGCCSSMLYEVCTGHWIGVWRPRHIETHSQRPPDLAFRLDRRGSPGSRAR